MARLQRNQVMLLTGWDDARLADMVRWGLVTQEAGGYVPVELWVASPKAREAFDQLLDLARQGEDWWTQLPSRWIGLEVAGLVEVLKPSDAFTGYWKDRQEWRIRLTELGREVARELLQSELLKLG